MSARFQNFAYGSNMCSQRLLQRCPSAKFVSIASLPGYLLTFHKMSTDGSGKCNIEPTENVADVVWGVVFSILESERAALDEAEGLGFGYDATTLTVCGKDGPITAHAYVAASGYRDSARVPYDWYKNFVVAGAKEHDLPEAYIETLSQIETQPDLDTARAQRNAAICNPPRL